MSELTDAIDELIVTTADQNGYGSGHQAPGYDEEGTTSPLHDVEQTMPDYYRHPEWYGGGHDEPGNLASANVIHRVRGNPEARVRVYRALPAEHAHHGIRPGDWVGISKEYARQHGRQTSETGADDWPVVSAMVPAKHLYTEGYPTEWGYDGPELDPASHTVSFPGGRNQQVTQTADGSIRPVQRRAPSPVKGFSFAQEHDHLSPNGAGKVTAWDPDENYAGHIDYTDAGPGSVHVEPQHQELASELERRMRLKLPKHAAAVGTTRTAAEAAPRQGVPVHHLVKEPGVSWRGIVGGGGPLLHRNVGDADELADAFERGRWASHGDFTTREHEGHTQFTPDLEEAKSWAHPLRHSRGTPVVVSADAEGMPVRFMEEGGNLEHDGQGNGTFYANTGLGIGVDGGIPVGRIRGAHLPDGTKLDPDQLRDWVGKNSTQFDPFESTRTVAVDSRTAAVEFAAAAQEAGDPDFRFHVRASWGDVQDKAQSILASGGVRILAWRNGELVGHVQGDTNAYEATIVFVPGSRTTGSWNCSCAWAAYSWGRTGRWRKFEGRRCLVPDTMVSMADGTFKPISEVQVGEYVVTHDGIGQVTDTMVKPFQGDLVALSSDGDPRPITMTGDHEVWGHGTPQRLRKSWQNTKGQGFKFYDESFLHDESPRWIEAGNMQTYDWLTGVVRTHTHGGPFDVSSVLDEYEIEGDRIHAVYRHRAAGQTRYQGSLDATIRPSHALARIAGLYLAEGNIAEQTGRIAEIQFSVSADEADELTKMLDEALADLGSPGRVRQYGRKNHSGKSIRVTNRPLAQLMAVLCGRGVQRGRAKSSIGKRIHPWVMAWSPEHQHTLLDALHWGDGNHGDHSEHVIEKKVFTSDNHLAQQVVDMVHRCGMVASWSGRWQKGGPSSRDKQFWINTVRWSEVPSYSNGRRWNGSGRFAAKITRTEKVPYDGPVHDLTVYPQHSYVANGRVVHNCSHVLALQYKAQSQEMFGKDIRLDVNAPHWLDPTIPVKVPGEYDRDKGRHAAKVSALDWEKGVHPSGLAYQKRKIDLGGGAVLQHSISGNDGGVSISQDGGVPGELHYSIVPNAPVAGTDKTIPALHVNWVEVDKKHRGSGWASKMYDALREAHPGYTIPASDVLEAPGRKLVKHYRQKYPDVHTGRWDGEGRIHPTAGPNDPIYRPSEFGQIEGSVKVAAVRPWETLLMGDIPFHHVTRRPGPITALPASEAGESGPGVYLAGDPEYAQQMSRWDPAMRSLNVTVHAGDGLSLLDRTKPGGEEEYRRLQGENGHPQKGLAETLHSHGYDGVRNLSPGNKWPETVIHDPSKLVVQDPQGQHAEQRTATASITSISARWETPAVPAEQQAAFAADDGKTPLLNLAKNPVPGTVAWRGEIRHKDDLDRPPSVGMHWTVNPDQATSLLPHWKLDPDHRKVLWEARIDDPDTTIPRSHPIWGGIHRSMDSEAEVRFKPGANVHLTGAYVHGPQENAAGERLVPMYPDRSVGPWTRIPMDVQSRVEHKPTQEGSIDYSSYFPQEKTAAVRTMSPAEYGKLKILDFPKIHDLPALAKQLRQDAPEYYQSLHDDIAANGIKTPVLVDGDTIMSGHHRLSIAHELGIHAPVANYNDNDAYSANTTQAPLVRDWMQKRYDLGSMRSNIMPWMWQEPEKTAAAVPAELDPGKPQLDVKDYEGEVGNDTHITRGERGWLPTSAVAQMPGARGEVPGAHARREGADWEDFKSDIAANGIREPLFITVDHNGQPQMSEGNHRRDAAVELGHSHVPVQIRYFGHAEQQGTVHDRTPNQRIATVTINYMRNNGGMRGVQGFGQDVEPWGKYMSEQDPHIPPPEGWEHGQVTFTNPLRLEHEDGGWKQRLSQQHGGLVGKELSQALLAKGHDAVITHDKYGTGEIVDLRELAGKTAAVTVVSIAHSVSAPAPKFQMKDYLTEAQQDHLEDMATQAYYNGHTDKDYSSGNDPGASWYNGDSTEHNPLDWDAVSRHIANEHEGLWYGDIDQSRKVRRAANHLTGIQTPHDPLVDIDHPAHAQGLHDMDYAAAMGLLAGVAGSTPINQTLHRGRYVHGQQPQDVEAEMRKTKGLDFPLTSFTTGQDHAGYFAHPSFYTDPKTFQPAQPGQGTQVMYHLEPGAKGVRGHISTHSLSGGHGSDDDAESDFVESDDAPTYQGDKYPREIITGGHFNVTKVHRKGDQVHVGLQQTHVYLPQTLAERQYEMTAAQVCPADVDLRQASRGGAVTVAAQGTPEQQEQVRTMQERGLPSWVKAAPLLTSEQLAQKDASEPLIGDMSHLNDRHRSVIHHQLSLLPEHDKQVLRQHGTKINGIIPTKDDRSLSINGANYHPSAKAVQLNARDGEYPRWLTDGQSNTILHELGHAMDHAKDDVSQTSLYKRLIPRGSKMHGNKAQEVFAEAYAATHGGYTPRGFKHTDDLQEIARGIAQAPMGVTAAQTCPSDGQELEYDPLDGYQHPDGSIGHEDGRTVTDVLQDEGIPLTPEVTGLPTAISYSQRTTEMLQAAAATLDHDGRAITAGQVTGPAVDKLGDAHGHILAAAVEMAQVQHGLELLIPVREAREAVHGDAGNQGWIEAEGGGDHVLDHVLSHLEASEETETGEMVPSRMHGHPGYPLHELDDPKGNSELRDHLIHQHGYDRGDIGRSPKQVHDGLHATEDGVFHPTFRSGYDSIVDHRHKSHGKS